MPSIRLLLFFLGVESAIGVPTLEPNLSRPVDEILNCHEVQPAAPPGSLPARAELLPAGNHEERVLNSRKRARVDQPSAARIAEPELRVIQGASHTQVMSPVAADRIAHERPLIPSTRSQQEKRVRYNEQPVTVDNLQGPLGHLQTDSLAFHSNVGTVGLWNHGQVPGRDQPYAEQHGVHIITQDQDINHYHPFLDQIPQFNPEFYSFPPSSLESSSGAGSPLDPNLSSQDWLQEFLDDPQNMVAFDHMSNEHAESQQLLPRETAIDHVAHFHQPDHQVVDLAALDHISNEHAESQQLPREAVIDHFAHFHQPDHQVDDQADMINPDDGLLKSTIQIDHTNTNPARVFGTASPPDFLEIKKLLIQEIESGLKRVNTQIYLKIGNFKLYDVNVRNYPSILGGLSQDAEQDLSQKRKIKYYKVLNWMTRSIASVYTEMSHETGLIKKKIIEIAKQEPYLQQKVWDIWWPSSTRYFNMIKYTKIRNLLIVSFIDQKTLKTISPNNFKTKLTTFMDKVDFYSGQIFEYLSANSKENTPSLVTQGHFLEWVSHALFADQEDQIDFKIPIFGSFSQELIDSNTPNHYYHPVQLSIIRALVVPHYDSYFKYHETAMALCGYWLEYKHPEIWNQNFKNRKGYSFFLFETFREKI